MREGGKWGTDWHAATLLQCYFCSRPPRGLFNTYPPSPPPPFPIHTKTNNSGTDGYATIKLPSGEQRLVSLACTATIGALGNAQHKNVKHGKAGATRWRGRKPRVRGMAMNSVDHPHGGGRGKVKGRISQTPWGVPTKGHRTRDKGARTNWAIVTSRHKAKH